MFILKDTNGECNLRDFLYAGAHEKTWGNISRWAYGIIEDKKDWEDASNQNSNFNNNMSRNLRRICAVNIVNSN